MYIRNTNLLNVWGSGSGVAIPSVSSARRNILSYLNAIQCILSQPSLSQPSKFLISIPAWSG